MSTSHLPPSDVEAERLRLELRLALLEAQEKARGNFLNFSQYVWPEAILSSHHQKMAAAFDRIANGSLKRLIINMPPRHRLLTSTAVPTTEGWKTVETVAIGDYVFSPDGSPVRVTGKSDVYEEDLYEVETSDGQVIECDGEHLWTVRFGSGRPFETLSTAEILHRLETQAWRKDNNYPMLPPQSAALFPYRELAVDPYVLGVWLGDGSSSSSSIGCSFKDMSQMRQQVEACGYQTTHNPKFQQFNVLGLLPELRKLGVLGNKHIPEIYLCSSVEQRVSLLQGLIDTDGDVTKEGKVTFNQTNPVLMEQVLCLIHSLGAKARITTRSTSYKGVPSQVSYRIMFKMAGAARLPRKASRCCAMRGNWSRSIDVRRVQRRGLVRCLEVANADGLFMAGRGWVVTHNTKSEFASYLLPAFIMGRDPRTKIIQATHTGELAVRFGRKVRNLMEMDRYQELFPDSQLQADSKAAGRWDTNHGGEYFAVGVGGAMTGRGANLLIIDDPHSEQDAKSQLALDNAWDWYTSGPRSRLQPGGAVVIVMCMTGDTPVLMADGTEKRLDRIRPGDRVATFDEGRLAETTVNNWRSSGVDSIYRIQTRSGKVLRANERHPFLVMNEGVLEWTRLKHLQVGDELVSLKAAFAPHGQRRSRESVDPVISDFTTDPIVAITYDGEEEVFDVEIDRTENFIANGFVSHNTRWGTKDLTARLLKSQSSHNADTWEVIEFPAIFDEGTERERPLWPSFWKLEELKAVKASLSIQKWNAMYQQRPTADEGAILKREWWRIWDRGYMPQLEYIIQSYDTAYSKKETADYSVITTWGVFYPDGDSGPSILLVDCRKGRWDFPELKRIAREQYSYWRPDNVLIEAKATGITLQQELRRMGIPVTMYSPGGRRAGQDKLSRANSVAPILESGMVWAPDTDWAEELVEECAAFPNGDNDDMVDSTTQALMRFRAGNFVVLQTDERDEPSSGVVPEYY